ncbi:MAG: hypothetical protein CMO55_28965 [Verrucomicrobiales bacterium]|nr:hypothetical protein [Verrucomicrobiales bacterium]
MSVSGTEDIARAICSDKWDAETGILSASLFKGAETSVSRLSITPLEDTWTVFRKNVEKPPERLLDRIGIINVQSLMDIGSNFEANPTRLSVEPDPLDGYPSHAIIPQKISRGLANKILKSLDIREEVK